MNTAKAIHQHLKQILPPGHHIAEPTTPFHTPARNLISIYKNNTPLPIIMIDIYIEGLSISTSTKHIKLNFIDPTSINKLETIIKELK